MKDVKLEKYLELLAKSMGMSVDELTEHREKVPENSTYSQIHLDHYFKKLKAERKWLDDTFLKQERLLCGENILKELLSRFEVKEASSLSDFLGGLQVVESPLIDKDAMFVLYPSERTRKILEKMDLLKRKPKEDQNET